MFKLDLEKAEEPEIKLPTSIGSQKKQAVVAAKSLQLCPTLCNPIDGSPPGSPIPWDCPSKNTGVGCHFLLQCMKVKSESEVAQSCLTQRHHGLQPTRLLRPWNFPGKSTGVGCQCLLRNFVSRTSLFPGSQYFYILPEAIN